MSSPEQSQYGAALVGAPVAATVSSPGAAMVSSPRAGAPPFMSPRSGSMSPRVLMSTVRRDATASTSLIRGTERSDGQQMNIKDVSMYEMKYEPCPTACCYYANASDPRICVCTQYGCNGYSVVPNLATVGGRRIAVMILLGVVLLIFGTISFGSGAWLSALRAKLASRLVS